MIINNAGCDHCHDADFFIDRPDGSGDNLLLILKTDCIFTIDSKDILVPADSVFLYPKGRPQFYRCVKGHVFANDWIHFDFSSDMEHQEFLRLSIPFETPIKMDTHFLSYCVRSIVYENYSDNPCRHISVDCFMKLIFIKLHEHLILEKPPIHNTQYDMLSTIRSKIYAKPYEQRTVDSTAHEIRMSRSTFQRAYKKHFGVTFIEDLNNSRISYAEVLLTTTPLSVDDISRMCGYRTYVHFNRRFKEKNGMIPSEYRKMKQNVT
jgi:AraC-like DNA-binding protein